MRTLALLLGLVLAASLPSMASAQAPGRRGPAAERTAGQGQRGGCARGQRGESVRGQRGRADELRRRIDRDSDGRIGTRERLQARGELRRRVKALPPERKEELRQRVLERFDLNGDGRLDAGERARIRESWKQRGGVGEGKPERSEREPARGAGRRLRVR